MTYNITVSCQYNTGPKGCGNRTTSPTGLCQQHRNSVPMKDIHAGTGKKPLMSAIPRVGPVVTNSETYTIGQPTSNEELVERLQEGDRHWERDYPEMMAARERMSAQETTPSKSRSRSKSSDSSAADSAAVAMDAANIATTISMDISIGII